MVDVEKGTYDYYKALMRAELKKKRDERNMKNYSEVKENSFNSGYEDRNK